MLTSIPYISLPRLESAVFEFTGREGHPCCDHWYSDVYGLLDVSANWVGFSLLSAELVEGAK